MCERNTIYIINKEFGRESEGEREGNGKAISLGWA